MDKMDTFGKSDPFLVIFRDDPTAKSPQLYTTEVVDKNLNPSWQPFTLSVRELTAGNPMDAKLVIQCFDKDLTTSEEIGTTTVITRLHLTT